MSYLNPNTKKAIKIALFIKGITGVIATTTFITLSPEWTIVVLVVGAAANEIINCLSDHENPNTLI